MIKLIPIRYRQRISKWLLGDENSFTEHRVVNYHPKSEVIRSEHQYDLGRFLETSYSEEIKKDIKRQVVTNIVEKAIESGFVQLEETEDPMNRIGILRAELRVHEIVPESKLYYNPTRKPSTTSEGENVSANKI